MPVWGLDDTLAMTADWYRTFSMLVKFQPQTACQLHRCCAKCRPRMEWCMKVHPTALQGVVVVESTPFVDHRGAFSRLYCEKELSAIIGDRRIVQINHSRTSTVGAVRGMHYQPRATRRNEAGALPQGARVGCGRRFAIRFPTFLQWHAEELTPDKVACWLFGRMRGTVFKCWKPRVNCYICIRPAILRRPKAESDIMT